MTLVDRITDVADIPHWNADRHNLWHDRYALRDEKGNQIEKTPKQTWERVATAIGDTDEERTRFAGLLQNFKFVPAGRILASAGAANETVAYNCYVIPVEPDDFRGTGRDSRDSIMDTINRMVQIMSRGGGVGINWSTLRPRGSHLASVNGTSSGSVGWMDVASTAVGEVIQGGSRRGAAMFMLHDWHPDILEFTDAKRDSTKITNANISVAISDRFMEAVKNDEDWNLEFPNTKHADYNRDWDGDLAKWKRTHHETVIYTTIKARELWNRICAGAWDNGEPGVVFLERASKLSTANSIENIISVNPCGEQPLGAYSVCNLGSMNLGEYLVQTDFGLEFDTYALDRDVKTAIRFLDNVIDKTHYIEGMDKTREQQEKIRRVGLGVMGLADVLTLLGIRYGSEQAIEFTEEVFETMKIAALTASNELAIEKGPALGWDESMAEAPYIEPLKGYRDTNSLWESIKEHGLRNLLVLTQAPTGTTSLLAGASSGIEPYFALEYERNDRLGKRMVRPWPYEDWLNNSGLGKDVPNYFVTANDLSVEEHVAMQAAAQKYIDSSISKTVNAPNSHKVEDVSRLYMLAYDSGLKGIAYFREGCNRATVLSRPTEEAKLDSPVIVDLPSKASPYNRPDTVHGTTQRMRTKHGHAFVTVNFAEDNGPIEVFVNVGRAASDVSEWAEGMGRLISLALRHGIDRNEVASQLTGVGGYSKIVPSLSTAVAEALMDATFGVVPAVPETENVPAYTSKVVPSLCTECGNAALVREEGCLKCQACGFAACG